MPGGFLVHSRHSTPSVASQNRGQGWLSLTQWLYLAVLFWRLTSFEYSQVYPQGRLQWKETPTTLLSSPEIFSGTEPQVGVIARMGCEGSSAEEVYLMLPLVWARAVGAAEQGKGSHPVCPLHELHRVMSFVLLCTRKPSSKSKKPV